MIDIKVITGFTELRKFPINTILFSPRDRTYEDMYILISGKVEMKSNYKTITEKTEQSVEQGDIFGFEGMFCKMPRSYTAVTTGDSVLAVLSKQTFLDLSRKDPQASFLIIQSICMQVQKSQTELMRLKTERQKLFEICNITEAEFNKSLLFPKGHGNYTAEKPDEFDKFLFKRVYTCPNCQTQISGFMQLSTKLIPDGQVNCDLRRKYKGFEPSWYNVITCPHCYFSALESIMNAKEPIKRDAFSLSLENIKATVELDFDAPKNLQQVFASYYLAAICANGYDKKSQILAKIWLNLSWLYSDVKDENMELYASKNAYEALHDYLDTVTLTGEALQMNLMVLGTLAKKIGDREIAFTHLNAAKRVDGGKQVYKQLIEREMDEIRDLKNAT